MSHSKLSQSLSNQEVLRYSRQIITPEWCKQGQERFRESSVLLVGLGAVGCAIAQALVAAGVGQLGLVDDARIKESDLCRQSLYQERQIGSSKLTSLIAVLKKVNSEVVFKPYQTRITANNAMGLLALYDVAVDAANHLPTRYLLSDVCVLLGKPLITGSVLRYMGHVGVFNQYGEGPCYRCLAPQVECSLEASNEGLLSPTAAIVGNMAALEVMKLSVNRTTPLTESLLVYDGMMCNTRLYTFERNEACLACGSNANINPYNVNYNKEFRAQKRIRVLKPQHRITPQQYKKIMLAKEPHLLLDVRPKVQQDIVKLNHARAMPLSTIVRGDGINIIANMITEYFTTFPLDEPRKVFVMSRRGNESQEAVIFLKYHMAHFLKIWNVELKDVIGGIEMWAKEIDPSMPIY